MANFDNKFTNNKFKTRFDTRRQDWETPIELFKVLDNEFHFTLDVCADKKNSKVSIFYSADQDALTKDWKGTCWMNPPFGNMKAWVIKAYNESIRHNSIIVCLLPARTNNVWWHEYCMKGEVRFIKGRPKFGDAKHGLPQPLAIVIFGKSYKGNYKSVEF
jgi:phage N-6-adenine-methyltransferase